MHTQPPRLPRPARTFLALAALASLTACYQPAAPGPDGRGPVAHEDAFGNVSYTTKHGSVEYIGAKRP